MDTEALKQDINHVLDIIDKKGPERLALFLGSLSTFSNGIRSVFEDITEEEAGLIFKKHILGHISALMLEVTMGVADFHEIEMALKELVKERTSTVVATDTGTDATLQKTEQP